MRYWAENQIRWKSALNERQLHTVSSEGYWVLKDWARIIANRIINEMVDFMIK